MKPMKIIAVTATLLICIPSAMGESSLWVGRAPGAEIAFDDDIIKTALECERTPLICTGTKLVVLHVRKRGQPIQAAVSHGRTELARRNGENLTVLTNRDLGKMLREGARTAVLMATFSEQESGMWTVNLSAQVVDGPRVAAIGCGQEEIAVVRTKAGWQCKSAQLERHKR